MKAGPADGEETEIICWNRMDALGRDETCYEGMNGEDGF